MKLSNYPTEYDQLIMTMTSLEKLCPQDVFLLLEEKKKTEVFPKGTILFKEGVYPKDLFCVEKGKAKLYKSTDDGKKHIIRIAVTGDVLGYRAILAGSRHSVTAELLEKSTISKINKDYFLELMKKNNTFSEDVVKVLCQELTLTQEKLINVAYKPVRVRLADALLTLENIFLQNHKGSEEETRISFSHENIASLIGTTRETVTRMMRDFERDGLIQNGTLKIKIIDKKALEKIRDQKE